MGRHVAARSDEAWVWARMMMIGIPAHSVEPLRKKTTPSYETSDRYMNEQRS